MGESKRSDNVVADLYPGDGTVVSLHTGCGAALHLQLVPSCTVVHETKTINGESEQWFLQADAERQTYQAPGYWRSPHS